MIWILVSGVVGLIGMDRKIGGFEALLFSLVFTPILGLIFTLRSGAKDGFDNETHNILREIRKNDGTVTLDTMENKQGLTPEMQFRLFKATKLWRSINRKSLSELDRLFASREIKRELLDMV